MAQQDARNEGQKDEGEKMSEETVEKVKTFFIEHPIHAFSVPEIAGYLALPTIDVVGAIDYLWSEDVVERRYVLSPDAMIKLRSLMESGR